MSLQLLAFVSGYDNILDYDQTNALSLRLKFEQKNNALAISIHECEGCFKGEIENSLMVKLSCVSQIETIKKIVFGFYHQTHMLVRHCSGKNELLHKSGTSVILPGKFQQVTKQEAEKVGSYTLLNNQYWTVK